MIFYRLKENDGFTLAELLVAMAIFGILIALVIANFNKGAETNKLKEASLKLAQNIRIAQSYALSGKSINDKVPAGGFGLNITGDTYNVFADQDPASRTFNNPPDGSAIIYENIAISFVHMKAYKLSGQSGNQPMPATIDVTFEPPTGNIHFCINQTDCSTLDQEVKISFLIAKLNDPNHNCRQVTVNKVSGQISEEGNINCVL